MFKLLDGCEVFFFIAVFLKRTFRVLVFRPSFICLFVCLFLNWMFCVFTHTFLFFWVGHCLFLTQFLPFIESVLHVFLGNLPCLTQFLLLFRVGTISILTQSSPSLFWISDSGFSVSPSHFLNQSFRFLKSDFSSESFLFFDSDLPYFNDVSTSHFFHCPSYFFHCVLPAFAYSAFWFDCHLHCWQN